MGFVTSCNVAVLNNVVSVCVDVWPTEYSLSYQCFLTLRLCFFFTTRVRSKSEGNVFTGVCSSTRGYPSLWCQGPSWEGGTQVCGPRSLLGDLSLDRHASCGYAGLAYFIHRNRPVGISSTSHFLLCPF